MLGEDSYALQQLASRLSKPLTGMKAAASIKIRVRSICWSSRLVFRQSGLCLT
jgi:hypothetical protein